MDIIKELLHALWAQDYETLANPSLVWAIYILLFVILFLENGLLPAAFLPGDSLLILVGGTDSERCHEFPSNTGGINHRSQSGLLGQLYSGAMAREYKSGTRVAIPSPRPLPPARA